MCTIPVNLAGLPAIRIPCGLVGRPAGGLPAHRPGLLREPPAAAAHALEGAIGFDAVPTFCDSSVRRRAGGHQSRHAADVRSVRRSSGRARPSAWEPVIGLEIHVELDTADQDVLRLRRRARATRPTPTPARSAWPIPARCRWSTSAPSSTPRASPWRWAARCGRAASSTARTTSIPTCPRPIRSASTTSPWPWPVRSTTGRRREAHVPHQPGAHGRGRRQADPRGRRGRAHRRLRVLAGRLQPRRHAAHRDRRASRTYRRPRRRASSCSSSATWSSAWA